MLAQQSDTLNFLLPLLKPADCWVCQRYNRGFLHSNHCWHDNLRNKAPRFPCWETAILQGLHINKIPTYALTPVFLQYSLTVFPHSSNLTLLPFCLRLWTHNLACLYIILYLCYVRWNSFSTNLCVHVTIKVHSFIQLLKILNCSYYVRYFCLSYTENILYLYIKYNNKAERWLVWCAHCEEDSQELGSGGAHQFSDAVQY